MSRLKSGLILKDRVFIPEYDSYTEMLEELGIDDNKENARKLFVRAELVPPNEPLGVFEDVDKWKFVVDQDILPEWYVAEYDEQRMREGVKKWAETHIFVGKNGLEFDSVKNLYLKDCKNVKLNGDSFAKLFNKSHAVLRNDSSAVLWGNSHADLFDESHAELWDNSYADLYDDSSAKLWENSYAVLCNRNYTDRT